MITDNHTRTFLPDQKGITLADCVRVESIEILGAHGLEILADGSFAIRHIGNILNSEEYTELSHNEAYRLYVSLHARFSK